MGRGTMPKNRLVEVTVNKIKVKIHSPATGAEIKQAAIDAGVQIESDFFLELEKGDERVPIGDDQKLTIEDGASFMATAGEQKPKFCLDMEGTLKPWYESTITTEQIIALGGWDPSLGAVLIDADNNERTLAPGETVELKPGMAFSKKIRFKRG